MNTYTIKFNIINSNLEKINVNIVIENSTSNNWSCRKWNNGDIEMWFSGSVVFEQSNIMSSGIPEVYMVYQDITLPLSLATTDYAISFASTSWGYSEWVESQINDINTIRIRKFGVYNSVYTVVNTPISLYVRGKWK